MNHLRKAMEKARHAGAEAPEAPLAAPAPSPTLAAARPEPDDSEHDLPSLDGGPSRGDGVSPVYTRTRVQPVDPDLLRRNRVLSLFHTGAVSNQVKLLRTQVLQRLQESGGSSVLVTSPRKGEGKTFTAVNLAVSIAHELNRTALLVDTDIRKPSVHTYFGLRSPLGLSDCLAGRAEIPDVLVNPGVPRLTVLPAGNSLANSVELLGSPRMAALVGEMRARYPDRVLVFDSPAVTEWADPLVFAQLVDGVLLVVEAERTPRKDLLRALDLLADRPLLGIVYNKSRDGG